MAGGYPSRDAYSTPRTDYIDRSTMHRFPWHDIDVRVNGLAAFDILVNFVQRWNDHRPRLNRCLFFSLSRRWLFSWVLRLCLPFCSVQIALSGTQGPKGVVVHERRVDGNALGPDRPVRL